MTSAVTFATVSFHKRDMIRFIQFPDKLAPLLQELLAASWAPGIKEETIYGGCALQFKTNRRPFGISEDKETVDGRRLVRDILDFLWLRGWRLVESIGHSQNNGTKETLIFRLDDDGGGGHAETNLAGIQPDHRQTPLDWMVVAMSSTNKMRLILDSNTTQADKASPTPAVHLVTEVKTVLEKLDRFDSGSWTHESYEFKLKGRPWGGMGEETVQSRVILLQLLALFDRLGWKSYASVGLGTEIGDFKRPDTWYFVRPVGWVAGSPFNDEVRVSTLDL
ncbi:hypothetical protein QBC34DRAFT_412911 [Podospora aff. communis PSN243]|uniref:Uncharacterized protein n=1 Tax=Podospora aff. communis PSN243 TaxID=3040156 RepID=A0AAV9GCQ0_9PEZI|nr:hypothetical protein QBC34DRAFT_412911 [Podospora aff. communis PSN243]